MNTALLGAQNFDPAIPRAVVRVLCGRHIRIARTNGGWLRPDGFKQEPTVAPCDVCREEGEYAAKMEEAADQMRAALLSSKLAHTRHVRGFVHAYHRDETSPTGVLLAASCEATRYDALAAELRGEVFAGALSPLSPTEGRAHV